MIVHERQDLTGVHVEEHHETDEIAGINSPFAARDLNFLGKARIDAQRHGLNPGHEAHDIIKIVLAAFFLPRSSQARARRVHRLALRSEERRVGKGGWWRAAVEAGSENRSRELAEE